MAIMKKADLDAAKGRGLDELYPDKVRILVGSSTCGIANGANEVTLALATAAQAEGLDATVGTTGCIGFCQAEVLVDVWIPGHPRVIYQKMNPEKAKVLIKAIKAGEVKDKWALLKMEQEPMVIFDEVKKYDIKNGNGAYGEIPTAEDVPFYSKQHKIAMRNAGYIDPTDLDQYIARGGFYALEKALSGMKPDDVINEVKESGLRGRGGGGFSTGRKWASARRAKGEVKYVLCNADEGDPGAYMDRSILEGDPYSVLEGMIIGAYAVGDVTNGYIYVRNEYPKAVQLLEESIDNLREAGLLGDDILGKKGFSFDIKTVRGGGAFVCGESTALMASIEGRIGEPRAKYVHTVEAGLYGCPTVLNNVETFANVPAITMRGSKWYSGIGSKGNAGTKAFSLVGNIKNTGLIEVPMGANLREIIYDIGGGIPKKNRVFKAVQTGGPSGGVLPEDKLDLPVDFDTLTENGSMMGSGGMIIMDQHTCMVDVARYFLDFLREESCGKCVPCRDGIAAMLKVLDRITIGEGSEGDVELLEELGASIQKTALCGLGQSAPNPMLSTIQYFRDEYETHIKDKKCPAGICKELITYSITVADCTGCSLCAKACPENCIAGEPKGVYVIDASKCIKCGACFEVCNFDAVVRK